MLTHQDSTFVNAFKGTAAAVGLVLDAETPASVIHELEDTLTNETVALGIIAEYARNSSGLTTAYNRSKLWGDSFADRAAAALGILAFARTAISAHSPSESRKHHWAPVCFSSRFHSVRPRSRKFAVPTYDYANGVKKTLPQSEMILPYTSAAGYNTSALEELYCVFETGYARVHAESLDSEESRFFLGVFVLAQALRMNTPDSTPPKTVSEFTVKFLASLDSTLTPTVHRMNRPAGFSPAVYFRKFVNTEGVAYVAPAARKLAVVFSATSTTSSVRKASTHRLRDRQRAGAIITKTPMYGVTQDFKKAS